jgi:hypothetical protein
MSLARKMTVSVIEAQHYTVAFRKRVSLKRLHLISRVYGYQKWLLKSKGLHAKRWEFENLALLAPRLSTTREHLPRNHHFKDMYRREN